MPAPPRANGNAPKSGAETSGILSSRSAAASWLAANGSVVLMVLVHFDVVEHGERVVDQRRQRAIERHQVGCDDLVVDAHEADRQALALLAGQIRLIEPDDALTALAGADQEDLGLPFLDRDLVRRDQRYAAPGDELRSEQR